jgi:hypothetical protein
VHVTDEGSQAKAALRLMKEGLRLTKEELRLTKKSFG